MLVKFTVEKWASFRDEASISMISGREKQHADRVPYVDTCDLKILPVSAIYGGNASGKSNLCQALGFVKNMVTKRPGIKAPIPARPFLLSKGSVSKPVKFEIVFLASGKAYALQFSVTRNEVIDEKLEELTASTRRLLYHRTLGRKTAFGPGVENAFLEFVERGTLPNQLFLNNAVSQNYEHFQPAYDWFDECLELITPDTPLAGIIPTLQENSPNFSIMNDVLARLDTGISSLGFEKVPIDSLKMPKEFFATMENNLTGLSDAFWLPSSYDPIAFSNQDGVLTAKKLATYHVDDKGHKVKFGFGLESDGSRRVIELLPGFLDLCSKNSNRVLVVDELDSSLHTLLTQQLLYGYLSTCTHETRSQLLFTTHDVMLMDQDLFRRDEMWVAERTPSGSSTLVSFSDFKDVRRDKDVRRSYLQGRLGGIPCISLEGSPMHPWPSASSHPGE